MPELNYNLSTGINQNNLLNVKLDTQERLRNLYEGLNLPDYQAPPAFIPKHFDTDELVKGNADLPTLSEALYSKDPAVVDAAIEQARYLASKDPTATGLGMQNKVRYQEGQEKFTDNHWWKENNQTMYGFNPYQSVAENEDFLHKQLWDNYSIGGKLWRGVGTFAGRTLSKLVTGLVGAVGDLGSMAWNGLQEIGDLMNINDGTKNNFWEDVSNNWLSRKMQQADDYTKNSILPTYKALDYDGKGAWSKLLDPYTWQNSFADGAGFLLQFAVPGAILGRSAQAGKLARGIGEFSTIEELAQVAPKAADAIKKAGMTIEQAKNVSGFTKLMGAEISDATKFGRVAGGATEFLTGSRNVGGITAHVFNTTLESVAETKEGFDHTVRELMEKGMSREDAVKIASENAPAQFWINMGILTASNAFENKLLQKAVGNRDANLFKKLGDDTLLAERKAATKVGKFFDENAFGKRFKFYGANSAKASFFEGYWEENAQTAAQRWARGEYERQGDDTGKGSKKEVTEAGLAGFFKQLYNQTIDAAKGNDREAADSIMAGAVIGVIGMGAFAKISGERKAIEKNKAETIARYTNTRDAWLSLSTLSPDIYEKDGTINKEKAQEKAKEIQEKLDKMGSVFQRTVTAEALTNPQEREKLQHKVFGDYVKAHILNGTEKALVQRLKDWGGKSQSELDMYGVSEEVKQDASKWSALAQTLVDKWNNEIKDIKYAAPKTETVESYFAKTAAVKSLIFDYTSLKEMSTGLAQKYSDLKDEVNPFSKFPDQQVYNEKHAELLALKTDLAENKVPVERDLIQSRIDDLEKEQAQRKKDLDTVGQTKADASGFLFPKGVDPKDNPIAIKDVNDFNHYQYQQTTHENAVKVHEQLIKDYSDPATGIQKYNDVVDFWSKAAEETAKKEEDEKAADEAKDTLESLVAQKQTLTEDLANAKTKEDRDKIEAAIKDVDAKIGDLTEVFGDTQDTGTSDTDSSDVDTPPPAGDQLGFQEFISELLAYVTPFKTVNKESRDERDDQNNIIPWKEYVLKDSYDHDLSMFVKDIALYPDKYDAFIIKDTEELLKQRLSAKRKEEFDIARATLGAIIVFREKGKKEWAKFEDRKDKPIIAFSYNEKAFETSKQERAKIKAAKTGMSVQEALDFYAKQQKIADNLRAMIINDEIKEVPVKAVMGSLGLHPYTTYAENALKRFQGFYDVNDPIEIVQDVNVYPENFELGEILLKIPKDKTDSGIEHYIPVRAGYLTTSNETLNVKIMNAVQSIQYAKFDDKKDAELIVQNFLKGLFYVNENQYFKVLKDGAKFKIVHFVKDKNGKEVASKTFTGLKLKLSKVLYNGTNKLSVYEKDSVTNKYVPTELSQKDYKSFIHNVLETKRKVMIIKRGKTEKIYTKKVNGYLNLETFTQEDVKNGIAEEATPENPLDAVFGPKVETFKSEEEQKVIEKTEVKSDKTPLDLEQMIREAELELEGIKKTIQEKIDGTELDEQKEFFKEKGDMLIEIKQGKIDEMKALLPKGEDKVQSPLEELRTEVEFDQPMANIPQTTNIKVNKKEYQIDFDNNKFISASAKTPTDIEKLIEYFENAHSYTIKNVNINGKSVYLVKYNKLGKFVILDENFNTTPETKEMLDNEEYKKFKNCE